MRPSGAATLKSLSGCVAAPLASRPQIRGRALPAPRTNRVTALFSVFFHARLHAKLSLVGRRAGPAALLFPFSHSASLLHPTISLSPYCRSPVDRHCRDRLTPLDSDTLQAARYRCTRTSERYISCESRAKQSTSRAMEAEQIVPISFLGIIDLEPVLVRSVFLTAAVTVIPSFELSCAAAESGIW